MENRKHDKTCKAIADRLIAFADGNIYRCPDCGAEFNMPDNVGDKFKCPDCGIVEETSEYEQLSILDYFNDFLDIDFVCDRYKQYKACRIMVAFGGPNIYINTWDKRVELFWWTERGEAYLPGRVCDMIDDFAAEIYALED